ncbi:MAG: HAD-IIB family hydrolase [Lysobacterales bacterium]|jgi:sucrose-phosphate synthase
MDTDQPKLYLLLISIHGLIRGNNLELGRDADTGGQTKYVVDLARALAENEAVERVDLVTRRIEDPAVSPDYAQPEEPLSEKARIVRIDAGPAEYIPKEQLWDHLDSFTDNLVHWIREQPRVPDIVHSHYADAGYVGVRLAHLAAVPLVHTGHSLGRDKRKRLLAKGLSSEEIEKTYNMDRRIRAEEELLANADLVITSTHNEIEEQYGLYNYYEPERMAVIPPGTDLSLFYPPREGETFAFTEEIGRFLEDPDKPLVLALSRPDERKNIPVLLEAFGESEKLRNTANLLIIAGNREDIRDLGSGARAVLMHLLLLIDRLDLYGRVAIPKKHSPDDVPEIYRMVSASRGVFINPALTEPFGLTLLEAAACGLPLVATENGGPVDIIGNCRNGLLVDPLDTAAIAEALLRLLGDRDEWEEASRNGLQGVREHYTWEAHANKYMEHLEPLRRRGHPPREDWPVIDAAPYRDRAVFSDLDQSLLGDPESLKRFAQVLRENRRRVTFGIATGRRIDSALAVIKRYGLQAPDVLISGLGTRIHYGSALSEDQHWADHVDHDWNLSRVRRLLDELPGLELQPRNMQSPLKISWYYDPSKAPPPEEIIAILHQAEVTANVFASFGQFLDIVPARASKGNALRYAALRLDIPLEQILVAGGSGTDEDMIRGNTLGVVVANRHGEELSQLADAERIYFSDKPHAAGILEAMEYYDFLDSCRVPDA